MDFDTTVKLSIYQSIAETTQTPTSAGVAATLGSSIAEVEAAFQQLSQKRLLVLESGDPSRIRMAPPFSGIKTQHVVEIAGKSYFANCAWDAFGIAAALHQDAGIVSTCDDCGQTLNYEIKDGRPLPQAAAVHFAVPAAHWWQDIIYT